MNQGIYRFSSPWFKNFKEGWVPWSTFKPSRGTSVVRYSESLLRLKTILSLNWMSYTELFYHLSSGGWMMIGNYISTKPVKNVATRKLHKVPNGNILFGGGLLKQLEAYYHFSQIRVYCYKPSVGRVVHFTTKLNEMGIKIRNTTVANTGFTGYNIDVKKACKLSLVIKSVS